MDRKQAVSIELPTTSPFWFTTKGKCASIARTLGLLPRVLLRVSSLVTLISVPKRRFCSSPSRPSFRPWFRSINRLCSHMAPQMHGLKSSLILPPSVTSELRILPSGAQLLGVTPKNAAKGGSDSEFVSAWGIPRPPDKFVLAAIVAGHPCRNDFVLPPPLASAIDRNATKSSECKARSRAMFFKKWIARSKELPGQRGF